MSDATVTIETPLDDEAAAHAALAAMERLSELRQNVEEAEERYERARERAKDAKTELETAQEAFLVAFDHELKKVHGETEDLPLFNQTDRNEAQRARPEVKAVVDLLAAVDLEIDGLVVAGWTDAERDEVSAWARQRAAWRLAPVGEEPEVPLILRTDAPAVDDVTPETLRTCLALLDYPLDVPDEATLATWSPAERREAMVWARGVFGREFPGVDEVSEAEPDDDASPPEPMPALIRQIVRPEAEAEPTLGSQAEVEAAED